MDNEKNKLFSLAGVKRTFLGYQPSFDNAKVVVLPVPYDSTTTYGVGTRYGPNAIIDASTQLEVYDLDIGMNICEVLPIHTLDELSLDKGDPARMIDTVAKAMGNLLKLGKKPVLLGGEHSISVGAVRGISKQVGDFSVLQIDAHTDLRNSYEGTEYSHACSMRRVREVVDNVVQVGIRSMCEDEARFIHERGLEQSIFYAKDFGKKSIEKIVSQLNDNVYVTVDVDGLDPSLIPGTGTPEPGGLMWEDILSLMEAVSENKTVLGFDIVEVLPIPPSRISEFTAAKLAYKMMGYFWRKK